MMTGGISGSTKSGGGCTGRIGGGGVRMFCRGAGGASGGAGVWNGVGTLGGSVGMIGSGARTAGVRAKAGDGKTAKEEDQVACV